MKDPGSDRFLSVLLSILVHAAIVAALLWGAWVYHRPKPMSQALAIEATVVRPEPASPPTTTPAPPAPEVDPAAAQKAREEEAARAQAAEQQRAEAAAAAERAAAAQAKQAREAQAEAEAQAQAEAEVRAAAEAKAKAKAKAEAEARAKAEAEAAQAAAERKAAEERARLEQDLHSQLAAEEHLNEIRASGALAQYQALIAARIERAWIKPPGALSGIRCSVQITQVPGGEVTAVHVGECNGDDAVRQSIEAAAYRASPLPPPPDPALFDRDVVVTFTPHE